MNMMFAADSLLDWPKNISESSARAAPLHASAPPSRGISHEMRLRMIKIPRSICSAQRCRILIY
jgi:hypothetical protein